MHLSHEGRLIRTDMWREGQWIDLWSVVHLLSGAVLGFVMYWLPFNHVSAVVIALLLLTGYEMWEHIVKIEEAPTNRLMDVVVGIASFLPTYFLFAPSLSETVLILIGGLVFTADLVLSVFGWTASRKAAALQARVRERYERARARRLARKALQQK